MVVKFCTMEFHEKLQQLRKQKSLTQEELAEKLYVSRTAISKWESGRGYPNIDSLKAISKFFSVGIDELLSGEEVLTIAEEDSKEKQNHIRDLIFGLLDCGMALLLFLPFFGQKFGETVREVSLLALTGVSTYLKTIYFVTVIIMVLLGIVTLALQNCHRAFWLRSKRALSFLCSASCVSLFILGQQPYAALYALVFGVIKVIMMLKQR